MMNSKSTIVVVTVKRKKIIMTSAIHDDYNTERIVEAFMNNVINNDCSLLALQRAVVDCGFDATDAHRAFCGDPLQALDFFMKKINKQTESLIATEIQQDMGVRDKIFNAVWLRLGLLQLYKPSLRIISRHLSQPQHLGRSLRYLYQTVDSLWYAIGDHSTDFNFYTKRATLVAIYGTTLVCWLRDTSQDQEVTRQFLINRLNNIMIIPKIKSRFKRMLSFTQS